MGDDPKPYFVVEVIAKVPVAVSAAGVPSIVVPTAAAQIAARPYKNGRSRLLLEV